MNKNTYRRQRAVRKNNRGNRPTTGVLSVSPAKNLQMVVSHNKSESGEKDSITRFIPLNKDRFVYNRFNVQIYGSRS